MDQAQKHPFQPGHRIPYCSRVYNEQERINLVDAALALMALTSPLLGERAICRGDEVICVAVAFPTNVAPIVQFGAVPVFVDVCLGAYNIDASQLETARSEKTKCVFLVHMLGNPFDLKVVKAFCDKYGIGSENHDLWTGFPEIPVDLRNM